MRLRPSIVALGVVAIGCGALLLHLSSQRRIGLFPPNTFRGSLNTEIALPPDFIGRAAALEWAYSPERLGPRLRDRMELRHGWMTSPPHDTVLKVFARRGGDQAQDTLVVQTWTPVEVRYSFQELEWIPTEVPGPIPGVNPFIFDPAPEFVQEAQEVLKAEVRALVEEGYPEVLAAIAEHEADQFELLRRIRRIDRASDGRITVRDLSASRIEDWGMRRVEMRETLRRLARVEELLRSTDRKPRWKHTVLIGRSAPLGDMPVLAGWDPDSVDALFASMESEEGEGEREKHLYPSLRHAGLRLGFRLESTVADPHLASLVPDVDRLAGGLATTGLGERKVRMVQYVERETAVQVHVWADSSIPIRHDLSLPCRAEDVLAWLTETAQQLPEREGPYVPPPDLERRITREIGIGHVLDAGLWSILDPGLDASVEFADTAFAIRCGEEQLDAIPYTPTETLTERIVAATTPVLESSEAVLRRRAVLKHRERIEEELLDGRTAIEIAPSVSTEVLEGLLPSLEAALRRVPWPFASVPTWVRTIEIGAGPGGWVAAPRGRPGEDRTPRGRTLRLPADASLTTDRIVEWLEAGPQD